MVAVLLIILSGVDVFLMDNTHKGAKLGDDTCANYGVGVVSTHSHDSVYCMRKT